MYLLADDDDVFLDSVYWAMIEGCGFAYIVRGASRRVAIKGAVELWMEKHPRRIPQRISAKEDRLD